MGGKTAGARLGKSAKEGQELLDNFFKGFPKVKEAIDYSKQFLLEHGYVEDFVGRRRHLPEIYLVPYEAKYKDDQYNKTFNPFLNCEDKKRADQVLDQYIAMAKNTRGNKEFEALQKEAAKECRAHHSIILSANTGRIAQAERQCFNARIQGCLDYDSIICTKAGLQKIGELVNQEIEVFDGEAWSNAIVLASGKKQKCILTTGVGNKIICSPDHKFFVIETSGKTSFKKLSELKKQDRLVYSKDAPEFLNTDKLREFSNINYTGPVNKNDYSFDDIEDPYIRGQLLGRIASDGGYILRADGGSTVCFFVAEHEFALLDFIKCNIPWKYSVYCQQKKNQKVYKVSIFSDTLVKECILLNIKYDVHQYFLRNSAVLRGFISGFFDGDGCSAESNNNISLVFGTQADFTNISNKISLVLSMFGIRNSVRYYKSRTRIDIKRADSSLFADRIGFINSIKQQDAYKKQTVLNNHSWSGYRVTTIKNIEITDEVIDMYDVCNTDRGYFVVNGLVTHNSAASLTKMAMVDIFNDERLKAMDAHLIITVHDEVLVECPAIYADEVEKILPEIMINAAKKGGDDVKQACDPYNVSRWYIDEYAAMVNDEYKKLLAGDKKKNIAPMSKEEALTVIYKDHIEIPEEQLKVMALTGEPEDF